MSKQTAVEWLINQLQKSKDFHRVLNEVSQMSTARIDIIGQAKAMHKEEIANAYHDGKTNGMDISHDLSLTKEISSTEYYNETYGGQDESNH